MKNLIKVMLLPVFLLASLSVFAKAPVFDGTAWDATFTPSGVINPPPAAVKKGLYYFDDALVGPGTMKLTASDTIIYGAVPTNVSGKWTFKTIGSEEVVKATYDRVIIKNDKVVKVKYTLVVAADTINNASGKLTINISSVGGLTSTTTWDVALVKIPAQ